MYMYVVLKVNCREDKSYLFTIALFCFDSLTFYGTFILCINKRKERETWLPR